MKPDYYRKRYPLADPWGVRNAKVGGPSTYRQIGTTCPGSCPYLVDGSCYGLALHTRMASNRCRGGQHSIDAYRAAARYASIEWAGLRLHTTGDFLSGGGLDREYLEAIEADRREVDPPTWTYTHVRGHDLAEIMAWSGRTGITVWQSDRWIPGGAVVVPAGTDLADLRRRNPGLRLIQCPAQQPGSRVTCQTCRACWTLSGRTIVFRQHAARRERWEGNTPGHLAPTPQEMT